MQLAQQQLVLAPEQGLGDPWRPAIARRLSIDQRRNDLKIGLDERQHLRWRGRRDELANSAAPFGGLSGFRA